MRLNGIIGLRKSRFVRTTYSRHMLAVAPDLLTRDLSATVSNQKWVTDITCLRTLDGWVFLAAIIDLFSQRVVGWSMAEHVDVALPLAALRKALASWHPPWTFLSLGPWKPVCQGSLPAGPCRRRHPQQHEPQR